MDYLDPDDFEGLRSPSKQGNFDEPPQLSAAERYLSADLADISTADLIDLYEEVKSKLPAHKLQDIDLAQELVLQHLRVKELQTATLGDPKVAANQKAQVSNAVSSILGQLTKLQVDLHTAERFKTLESLMIRHFKKLPLDVVEAFMEDYEQLN